MYNMLHYGVSILKKDYKFVHILYFIRYRYHKCLLNDIIWKFWYVCEKRLS